MELQLTRKLFTVHDYHRMAEAGILAPQDRVELIEGEILAMSPIGNPHGAAVDRAARALIRTAGDSAIVRIQGSVRLDKYNEPQPDIALLRSRDDFYKARHPGPADIFLIVEVSDSSLEKDKTLKKRVYARSGVPEYWISDLQRDCIIIHREPQDQTYNIVSEHGRGEWLAPSLLPECRIPVNALLP